MYYFIWNPLAGKGESERFLPVIKSFMDGRGLSCSFQKTQYPGHAAKLAGTAAKDPGAEAVVAVGGDGTILETASGLVDSGVPLACIPLGNGNDYISNFMDLSQCKTAEEKVSRCLNILVAGKRRTVDMITVNGGYAMNIGNIGLDADVADYGARIKHIFGSMSYFIAMFRSIFTYKPLEASVTIDGEKKRGLYTLIAVCNGKQYGGGFKIAPPARVDDGKLTVCMVDRIPRLKILVLFPLAIFGKHTRLKYVKFIECDQIKIEFGGTEKMCLDGNISAVKGPVSFLALPAALEMIVENGVLEQVDHKYAGRV